MNDTYRVLVTGSRDWDARHLVVGALNDAYNEHPTGQRFIVIHGGCKTGADIQASMWVHDAQHLVGDVTEEVHAADWSAHGPAAGPIRNSAMVRAGADVVLAFLKDGSRGATHCAGLAEQAGIPLRRWSA